MLCFILYNTQSCCLWQSSYLALSGFVFFSLSPRVNHRFELLHTNYLRTSVGISLARSRGGIHGQGIDRTKAFVP